MGQDRRARSTDAGFTLVEVIAALVMLGIAATAALYFFIEGTRTTTHLQRTQNAVSIANQAMELAYAIEPRDSIVVAGVPSIVIGRTKVNVEAAWASAAALGIDGLADTYPLWDTAATSSSVPLLPITQPPKQHSGQDYGVTILVGSCFRSSNAVATEQVCTRLPAISADPGDAGTPGAMVRMLRVIAVVTWQPTAGECPGSVCSYQLSGLVDRSYDIEWNQVFEPVAADDFATLVQSESRDINVLDNDLVGPMSSTPVNILVPPSQGSASAASNGMVTYSAPSWGSGVNQFTYRLKDARGASDTAVVYITVPPLAANDSVDALSGQPTTMNVTGNDNGSPVSVQIISGPNGGAATVSGLNIVYTASIATGLDHIVYRYTDGSEQVSPEATVTIRVESLTTGPRTIDIQARTESADVWAPLTNLILAGNTTPATLRINIVGARPAAGTLRVDGSSSATTGTTVDYSPARNVIGEYTFQYSLTRLPSGVTSPPAAVTIRVLPVATADVIATVLNDNGTRDVQIGANDRPTTFDGTTNVTVELGTFSGGCTDLRFRSPQDRLTSGVVRVTLPWTTPQRTCSFTYSLVGTGTLSGLRSGPVTVEFRFQ